MRSNPIKFSLALLVFGAAATPVAAVQSLTLTSAGIYSPGHVDYDNGTTVKNDYSVPVTLTATYGGGHAAFDALGFCIDITHNIAVGLNSQRVVSLAYHVGPLTTDSAGNPLSAAQIRSIGGLAAFGFGIAKGSGADKAAKLAGVQQAIWTIEYPSSTFTATGGFAIAQAGFAAQYLALAPTLHGFARTIYSDSGSTQGIITNVPGVPEPAMWVELVAGFGVVGAFARRRRIAAAVAA